jgi:hypothetical protein
MTPGPDCVVACPHCNTPARLQTIASGNTFGMQMWTDSYHEAPMMPVPPPIVECRLCRRSFWLQEATQLNGSPWHSGEWLNDDEERRRLPLVAAPQTNAIYAAIRDGLGDTPEKARAARLVA